jgi:hypothetical protein
MITISKGAIATMKKTIILVLVGLLFLIGFAACTSVDASKKSDDPVNFAAQYIRTDEYRAADQYPVITIITSKDELENLYAEKYDMSEYPYLAANINLDNALKNYSDDYFKNNFLVMIVLEESSGGTRHKIETINSDGKIMINRLLPEMGTADMAKWSIIIELENDVSTRNFTAEIVTQA